MEVHADNPHCSEHAHFVEACAVCRKARANFLPYPLRASKPLPRSFGYTSNITDEQLRGDAPVSRSLIAIRIILRLLWPFGRIGP